VILLAVVLALAMGNLWFTLLRSGIPRAFAGTVERIELREEKPGADDDVYLVTVGARTMHLDAEVARELRERESISKRAWSAEIRTPRGPIRLHPSHDVVGMAVVMPVVIVLAVGMIFLGRRPSRPVSGC
jgi:hypothetical protein